MQDSREDDQKPTTNAEISRAIVLEFSEIVKSADRMRRELRAIANQADDMIDAADRAIRLVRTIEERLEHAGLDGGCRLTDEIERLAPTLSRLAGDDVSVSARVDRHTDAVAFAPIEIESVLTHLVVAAREAYRQGGVILIRTEASPRSLADQTVRLIVEDDAGGLKPKDPRWCLQHAGEAQNDWHPIERFRRRVIETGGGVRVETQKGRHTRVVFDLPVLRVAR